MVAAVLCAVAENAIVVSSADASNADGNAVTVGAGAV